MDDRELYGHIMDMKRQLGVIVDYIKEEIEEEEESDIEEDPSISSGEIDEPKKRGKYNIRKKEED